MTEMLEKILSDDNIKTAYIINPYFCLFSLFGIIIIPLLIGKATFFENIHHFTSIGFFRKSQIYRRP